MRICPNCQLETEERVCPEDGYQTIDKALVSDAGDPLLGRVFEGRYRVDKKLGEGGMGAVYQATQLSVGRTVAIKIMHTALARNLKHAARFQQEARAIAALDHPNAVRLVDFGCSESGLLYLVMQFLTGRPLDEVLDADAPLPAERVMAISRPVLEVLEQAHGMGIIHRDLKPENIFLADVGGRQDFVKVLDFGIAKVSGRASARMTLTATGSVVGSPCYMSPEQATGNPITPLSDIYSLGVIMYELLTGQPLFDKQTANGYMMAHAVEPPRKPEIDDQLVQGPLVDFIMMCLEKDPRRRPQSAGDALVILNGLDPRATTVRPRTAEKAAATLRPNRPLSGMETNLAADTLHPKATWWRAPVAATLGFGAITALVIALSSDGPQLGERTTDGASSVMQDIVVALSEADTVTAVTKPEAAPVEPVIAPAAGVVAPSADAATGTDVAVAHTETDAIMVAEPSLPAPEPVISAPIEVTPPAAPRYHRVTVKADPPGAKITLGGRVIGTGKALVRWKVGSPPPRVVISAHYHKKQTVTLRTRDSGKVRAVRLKALEF